MLTTFRSIAKFLAQSRVLAPIRKLHQTERVDLPLIPKSAASLFCLLEDFGNNTFPVTFDRESIWRSEEAYIEDEVEPVESDVRSPFWFGSRPHMNRIKIDSILRMFTLCDKAKLAEGSHILEVGGGTGWLAECLVLRGYNVITTTLSPIQSATAKLRSQSLIAKRISTRLDCFVSPMERIHEKATECDLVFAHGALHHAYSWEESLESMAKCVKPNGYMILADEPSWWHTFLCHRSAKIQGRHEVGISKRQLTRSLRSLDFTILVYKRALDLAGAQWVLARKN
jgi:2-polyprenyl-3-methyl-5-hydroxy-6-metoxy-1,4-benzoquinol methylase